MLSLITVFTLMMLPAVTILAFSLLVSAFEGKPDKPISDNYISGDLALEL